MSTNNGGPALPVVDGLDVVSAGMTLRDYFAAAVLPVIASWSEDSLAGIHKEGRDGDMTRGELVTREAYRYADAMLKEREK